MEVQNTQQLDPSYVQAKDGERDQNFRGRADIDKSDTSTSERQHQREGKPYSERYFKPVTEDIYNGRVETKSLHAGGNVDDDNTPFFSVYNDETLDDGTRKRCLRVMGDTDVPIFEVCEDRTVKVNGVSI